MVEISYSLLLVNVYVQSGTLMFYEGVQNDFF